MKGRVMKPTDDTIESVEQSQESAQPPHHVPEQRLAGVTTIADQLAAELADLPDGDLVAEIVYNSVKLLRDQTNRGDIKLINKSLKELRYAMKVFAPYRDVRKVSIFGSARTKETAPDYIAASEFGRKMADAGWMVITGAGGGIMAAGHGGAGAEPSFGLAIRLPFEQTTNTFIANDPKLINFKYFFTRKLMFLRSSHAITLFPGGFGTMDEGFESLTLIQTGKSVPVPLVMIDAKGGDYWNGWQDYVVKQLLGRGLIGESDLRLYKITDDVDEAVREVTHFYNNYHSMRYFRDDIVLRLQRAPNSEQLEQINRDFADILLKGQYRTSAPLPIEKDEPALDNLARLVFAFNRRDHGRLRILIDHLNDLP
jgi:uncharacterized protein (TIGR00730 family)